jgi:hypothetical protein
MRPASRKLLLTLALFCAIAPITHAAPLTKAALIGQWDYTSYTIVEDGKPGGSVQMQSGTVLFTYREDGTWNMQAADPDHTKLNGTYEIHGSELIMKKADGSPYQDFEVELTSDGKDMTMKDKRSIVTATKLPTTP